MQKVLRPFISNIFLDVIYFQSPNLKLFALLNSSSSSSYRSFKLIFLTFFIRHLMLTAHIANLLNEISSTSSFNLIECIDSRIKLENFLLMRRCSRERRQYPNICSLMEYGNYKKSNSKGLGAFFYFLIGLVSKSLRSFRFIF